MAFNHYAKIQRILAQEAPDWYIRRIDTPTEALNFRGETIRYDHYYRIFRADDTPIKYCKFQKIDQFAQIMKTPVEDLPLIQ